MDLVKLNIVGITYSQSQKDSYVLILSEENGTRRIPIIIGTTEAQAIALELEHMKSPRPLTHDLIKTLGDTIGFFISDAFIYKFEDGVFYSRISVFHNEQKYDIDSRTSDAVALAMRFHCPIYTTQDIISQAGFTIDDKEKEDEDNEKEVPETSEDECKNEEKRLDYIFDSDEELKEKLDEALKNEDYERASLIRDEIKSRNK